MKCRHRRVLTGPTPRLRRYFRPPPAASVFNCRDICSTSRITRSVSPPRDFEDVLIGEAALHQAANPARVPPEPASRHRREVIGLSKTCAIARGNAQAPARPAPATETESTVD